MFHKYTFSKVVLLLLGGICFVVLMRGRSASAALAAGPACNVGANGSADYVTIQAAVDNPSCTSITIAPGRYTEHVAINRDLSIIGAGADKTIVDGSKSNTVFALGCYSLNSGNVHISDLTIQNGTLGICNKGTATLVNSVVSNSTDGGIVNNATMTISNTAIVSNTASGEFGNGVGAGLLNTGKLTIDHSQIISNTVSGNGGGLYSDNGSLLLTNSTVRGNTSNGLAGGLFISGQIDQHIGIANTTISGNSANQRRRDVYPKQWRLAV